MSEFSLSGSRPVRRADTNIGLLYEGIALPAREKNSDAKHRASCRVRPQGITSGSFHANAHPTLIAPRSSHEGNAFHPGPSIRTRSRQRLRILRPLSRAARVLPATGHFSGRGRQKNLRHKPHWGVGTAGMIVRRRNGLARATLGRGAEM